MTKGTFCATPFLVDLLKKKIIQEEYDCCCTHLHIHVCDLSFPYSNIFYQAIVDLDNKIICMNGNNSWPPVVCSGFYQFLHIRIEITLGVKLRDIKGLPVVKTIYTE
jgi:hypothetical protein